jgi:hypothetical protein
MSPEDPLLELIQIEVPDHPASKEDDAKQRDSARVNGLQIASPCAASWEEMMGDNLVRSCSQCQQNVYNVSGMTRREAADFVREAERRLGVRFYRRWDGTLLRHNCPVGRRSARRRLLGDVAVGSVLLFVFAGVLLYGGMGLREGFRQWGLAVELGQAIMFGDAHKVETVLRAGADPNLADEDDSLLLARGHRWARRRSRCYGGTEPIRADPCWRLAPWRTRDS